MSFKKRYTFLRVLGVVTIVCVSMLILDFLLSAFVLGKEQEAKEIFSGKSLLSHTFSCIFLSFFYYAGVNLYYTFIVTRKKFFSYFLLSLILAVAYTVFSYTKLWEHPEKLKQAGVTIQLIIVVTVLSSLFMTAIALLVAHLTNLGDGQKQRKELEKQKMELEMQNTQANLNFLKAQINPHFLHNTLNFLYAKSLPYSAELSEGILCLADIMRYALNEERKDGKALLSDEIEHLENVIKINQFRFSNNLNVQFTIKGEVNGKLIVPFVLITLVENAFKHGDLKSANNPIIIKLELEGNCLYFYCGNKKNPGSKEISTGIGLPNILKRLSFAYGTGYTYNVKDSAEYYATELTINAL